MAHRSVRTVLCTRPGSPASCSSQTALCTQDGDEPVWHVRRQLLCTWPCGVRPPTGAWRTAPRRQWRSDAPVRGCMAMLLYGAPHNINAPFLTPAFLRRCLQQPLPVCHVCYVPGEPLLSTDLTLPCSGLRRDCTAHVSVRMALCTWLGPLAFCFSHPLCACR